jgi:hypothetical protein
MVLNPQKERYTDKRDVPALSMKKPQMHPQQ